MFNQIKLSSRYWATLWTVTLCVSALFIEVSRVIGSPSNPASFNIHLEPAISHDGETTTVVIDAAIDPGWHLYGLVPTPQPGPVATSFTINGENLSLAAEPTEDPVITQTDPNFGKVVSFHENHAEFKVPVQIAPRAASGALQGQIVISYQTCNSTVCLPPKSITLPLTIQIEAGAVRPQYTPPNFASPKSGSMSGDLLGLAIAAFGAGLLALLTPCVFPLIPVTFGFFTKQIGDDHRKLIILASIYALGIIVSFILLGVVSSLIFGAAGANKIAANPWFNLVFGLVFVIFAFSFFESFLFSLPPQLANLARPVTTFSGPASVLLMGLAFVFAAFTCTAPFIGTILVAAASASGVSAWVRPLFGMFFFALALALPFFILALFPTLLKKLPKSGGWLTRFKATLGFVELAYALTYFSKADLVWQAHILTEPVILAIWGFICLCATLYLTERLQVAAYPDEPEKITPGKAIAALVFTAAGLYCFYGLTGRPISGLLLSYLPPSGYSLSSSSNTPSNLDDGWLSQYDAALAQAKSTGKPVFIDFTGYTCTNCRYVEQNIFPQSPVKELLANSFVRLRLYTDGGVDGAKNQAFQQKIFGTLALPLYAIVSPDGIVRGSIGGSGNSVAQFASFMTKNGQQAALPNTAPSITVSASSAWSDFSQYKIAEAKAAGQPVVIDFTAKWCTNCHTIERTVFSDPAVSAKLNGFTTLRADLTDFSAAQNVALENKYNVNALPAVLFLDSNGVEVSNLRVTGLIPATDFLSRLQKVKPN